MTAGRIAEIRAYIEAQKFGPNMLNGGYACDNCGGVDNPGKDWAAWPAHAADCSIGMLVDLLADRQRVWKAAIAAAAKKAENVRDGYSANIRTNAREQEFSRDPDGPWVLNSDVAAAIRSLATAMPESTTVATTETVEDAGLAVEKVWVKWFGISASPDMADAKVKFCREAAAAVLGAKA